MSETANNLLTRQMAANVVDLVGVLASPSRTVSVRLIGQDLNTAASSMALLSTLFL